MYKNSIFKQLVAAALISLPSTSIFSAEITGEFSRAFSGEGIERIQLVFTIEGDGTSEYAVFAQGPSLANEGVTGFLANPKISLIKDGQTIATNDNWGDDASADRIQEVAENFGITLDPLDAAMVRNLGAGLYTVGVDGADGGVGITRVGAIDSSGVPEDGQIEITSGLWSGDGVCFFVNDEGTKIVESDQCDNGKAFSADIDGFEFDIDGTVDPDTCNSNVVCGGAWEISSYVDGQGATITRATCFNEAGGFGDIIFQTSNQAVVWAYELQSLNGRMCAGPAATAAEGQ